MTAKIDEIEEHQRRRANSALSEVTATMGAVATWLQGRGVSYEAADLIAGAKMVLRHERDLADTAKREKWEAKHRIGEDTP